MEIVGIIPARYQSTRFPGKPLAELHGKPMIRHVYERSLRARTLSQLLVATDDLRILKAVEAFGGNAMLTREDHPSGTDRLAEAAEKLRLSDKDIVVNIQGDEPLVEPEMIEVLVEALLQSRNCPMATLAFLIEDREGFFDPNVVKVVVDENGRALYFSRSPIPFQRDDSDKKASFLKHLGYYAYRSAFLSTFAGLAAGPLEEAEKLEQLRALEYGYPIQVAISPFETIGVDTPEDLERAARILG